MTSFKRDSIQVGTNDLVSKVNLEGVFYEGFCYKLHLYLEKHMSLSKSALLPPVGLKCTCLAPHP